MTTLRLRDLVVDRHTITLDVHPGELVAAIAGPEVSTMLARTVVGLAAPASGRVLVGDRDVTDLPPADRQTGYVPAGGALLPHLTIEENIRYGLHRLQDVREVRRDWVDAVVERLELAPSLLLRPHHLTGAQRLRAALARAMARLPVVLVVDLPRAGGGVDRLDDLVARAVPDTGPGVAVLVCSADPAVLDGVTRRAPV